MKNIPFLIILALFAFSSCEKKDRSPPAQNTSLPRVKEEELSSPLRPERPTILLIPSLEDSTFLQNHP